MATIEARITRVEHDVTTGWYTISTDHATVKKLTTKMEQKAQEAAGLRQAGDVAQIEYSPKQRHDEATGRTYNNNYYERAKTAPPQSMNGGGSGGIDSVGGTSAVAGIDAAPTSRRDPLESWRIALSVGAKLAVATLPMMPTEQRDFETQKKIALAWASWVYTTPPSASDEPASAGGFAAERSGGPGAYDEPTSYAAAPPPGDEDDGIPF
jgi:hypothetical protein